MHYLGYAFCVTSAFVQLALPLLCSRKERLLQTQDNRDAFVECGCSAEVLLLVFKAWLYPTVVCNGLTLGRETSNAVSSMLPLFNCGAMVCV